MKPRLRKLALIAHVVASVGWFGAVAAFLALAVTGVSSRDPQIARAAYLAMGLTTRLVILPFALAFRNLAWTGRVPFEATLR